LTASTAACQMLSASSRTLASQFVKVCGGADTSRTKDAQSTHAPVYQAAAADDSFAAPYPGESQRDRRLY